MDKGLKLSSNTILIKQRPLKKGTHIRQDRTRTECTWVRERKITTYLLSKILTLHNGEISVKDIETMRTEAPHM